MSRNGLRPFAGRSMLPMLMASSARVMCLEWASLSSVSQSVMLSLGSSRELTPQHKPPQT